MQGLHGALTVGRLCMVGFGHGSYDIRDEVHPNTHDADADCFVSPLLLGACQTRGSLRDCGVLCGFGNVFFCMRTVTRGAVVGGAARKAGKEDEQ